MPNSFHLRLSDAKERLFRLQKAERRIQDLQKRVRELERQVIQLEIQLEDEQADVDKLTRMSLTNLFHTILRSKTEQLEMERQQALSAALKLQEAKQTLADTQSDLRRFSDDLSHYRNAKREYDELLLEREAFLRSSHSSTHALTEMEEQIGDQSILVKELHEAWTAGRRVLSSLEDASASLEKAENWGKWDMWANGGLVSTHIKHNHVDDAKQFIHNANHQLLNFRDELADVKRSIAIEVDISSMLKMADYWFDGLISDWIVQGRIRDAHDKVLDAIHRIRTIVNQLQTEHQSESASLQTMKTKRTSWIETFQAG
ncbi:hypothetical protein [Paenibacillus spongiae]|uniref:Uncharacterized protein n=1 Tax=Paenibacillus spongiae TaxID=2909671 RepID=A0ABY5S5Y6_9BACL|nr:hypothetical protein [Paenibacillus spongiae]UVI28898.1 hypothetical protein L1F29_26175 [Paenibacillus spongiae]